MKNTIINYEREEVDGMLVPNYFSKKVHLDNIIRDISDMIDVYQITDNDKIERISYELYGTTDYWDVLLLINERDPLFDMPYDYDNVQTMSRKFADIYRYFIYSNAPLVNGTVADNFYDDLLNRKIEENESFRFMHIIRPSRMGEFLKLAKDNSYL